MKVKIFHGHLKDVERDFNNWAKGKAVTKEIIIHSQAYSLTKMGKADRGAIFVYYSD